MLASILTGSGGLSMQGPGTLNLTGINTYTGPTNVSNGLVAGWGHEFADTVRPVTASFLGAAASPFTTFGATPQRDSVVLGLAATTAIADATSAYLRYEGDVSYQNANHALTAGIRMVW